MANLTVRSKKYLEKLGYTVERTEHFNWYTKRKVDLLGVGDLLALNGKELLLVQVTSRGHLSTRRRKAQESEKLRLWMSAKGKIVFHGWDKRKHRYRVKVTDLLGKVLEE